MRIAGVKTLPLEGTAMVAKRSKESRINKKREGKENLFKAGRH